MTLPELSIRRHVFAFMLNAVLILFGVIAYSRIGVDKLPYIEFPVISVTTAQKGANPDIVDASITNLIETTVNSVPGIEHIQSTSSPGASVVAITFNLDKVATLAAGYPQLQDGQRVRVRDAVETMTARLEREPKTFGWRMRARVGERRQWWTDVDELI